MRAQAVAFLRDVGSRPDSPEAGVARRAAGMTCWFAGEYAQARDHLERALALFEPGRDAGARHAACRLVRHHARHRGDSRVRSEPKRHFVGVDRAVSLIERMRARVAGLTNDNTRRSLLESFCLSGIRVVVAWRC